MAARNIQEAPRMLENEVRTMSEDEPSGTAAPRKSFQPYHAQSVPKSEDLEATAFERQSSGEASEVTTMMLRNIPNKYTQNSLLQEIKDLGFAGTFDFFYLPMDVHNRSNVGYAFINFLKPSDAELFRDKFSDHRFQRFQSRKISSVCSAHVQGLYENLRHFENRAVTHARNDQYRPVVLRNGVRVDIEDVLADGKIRALSSSTSSETRSGDSCDGSRTSSWCSSDRTSSKDGKEGAVGSAWLAGTKGNGKGGRSPKNSAGLANLAGPANKHAAGTAASPKYRAQRSPMQQAAPSPATREDLESALQDLVNSQVPAKSQQLPSAPPPGLAGGIASVQQEAAAAAALMGGQAGVQGSDIMQLLSLRSLILDRLPKDGVNQIHAYHQAAALLAMQQQQQQQMQKLQQEYQSHLQSIPTLSPSSSTLHSPSSNNWEEPAYIELSPSLYGGKRSFGAAGPAVDSNPYGDAWGMF